MMKYIFRTIYTNYLNVDNLETAIDLYKLAHLYETEDLLQHITDHFIENITVNNVLILSDIASTFENKLLQKACQKVLFNLLKNYIYHSF